MNKTMRRFIVVFLSAVLCGLMEVIGDDEMNSLKTLPTTKEIEEAAKVSAKKEELGRILLSTFADKNQLAKKRIECALALGKLKYLPAIPKLIEFIELKPSGPIIFHEPDITKIYPLIRALTYYGEAAVSQVVEAYARENNEKRQGILWWVIVIGETHEAAIEHAKKLMAEKSDEAMKVKLNTFIGKLTNTNFMQIKTKLMK